MRNIYKGLHDNLKGELITAISKGIALVLSTLLVPAIKDLFVTKIFIKGDTIHSMFVMKHIINREYENTSRKKVFIDTLDISPAVRNVGGEKLLAYAHILGIPCFVHMYCVGGSNNISEEKTEIYVLKFHEKKFRKNLNDALERSNSDTNNGISVYRLTGGGFVRTETSFSLGLANLTMNKTVTEQILPSIKKWGDAQDLYEKNNIGYRRGVLLLGSPGTGKSTVAKLMSHTVGVSRITYINLASVSDADLISTAHDESLGYNPEAFIIEDADSFSSLSIDGEANDKDNTDKKDKLTRAGVLSFLERASVGGTLIILTANSNPFSEAVIRPGRIDEVYEIGLLEPETIKKRLIKNDPSAENISLDNIKPMRSCDLYACIVHTIDNPVMLTQEVLSFQASNS